MMIDPAIVTFGVSISGMYVELVVNPLSTISASIPTAATLPRRQEFSFDFESFYKHLMESIDT
jgi:hypothetical protein